MSGTPLDCYIGQFKNLSNRDRAHDYSGLSTGGAPHQPLLLLAVLDLYARDQRRNNFIELNDLLLELWAMYPRLIHGASLRSPIAMPAYALRDEPFWHLVPKPGAGKPTGRVRATVRFHMFFLGATLDDALHTLLQHRSARLELRRAIIETYFPQERWFALDTTPHRPGSDELATSAYTQRLLSEQTFGKLMESPTAACEPRILRDSSFRTAVTFAYDYRCAFCGVRLRGTANRAVVEAAHIVPWAETRDDRPVNGLCLCPLCHWAFDARMLALDLAGKILTHVRIQSGDNIPGHLATLAGRPMFPPREKRFHPDPACLQEQLEKFKAAY